MTPDHTPQLTEEKNPPSPIPRIADQPWNGRRDWANACIPKAYFSRKSKTLHRTIAKNVKKLPLMTSSYAKRDKSVWNIAEKKRAIDMGLLDDKAHDHNQEKAN